MRFLGQKSLTDLFNASWVSFALQQLLTALAFLTDVMFLKQV